MSVYVDGARNGYGRMKMCHMLADTPEELMAMADKIGVQRKWFQSFASTPHFDIAQSKRALAVAAGALEVTRTRELADLCRRIRKSWPMVPGDGWLPASQSDAGAKP
jgi:hypothetical protein